MRPENTKTEQGRILSSGTFACLAEETAFRQKHLGHDIRLSTWCVLTAIAGAPFFMFHDHALFGSSAQFFGLVALRSVLLLASVSAVFALRGCKSPTRADRIMIAWCMLMAAGHGYALTTRPPGFVWHAMMCIGLIYCVLPLPLRKQLTITVGFSIGCFALEIWLGLEFNWLLPLAGAIVLINAFGALTSWQLNHRRRQVHLAWTRESHLREQLEQALGEIKTLRGLLSICAWCKRIRENDQWLPIEAYVKEHTQADFTHAICPHCFGQQFGKQGYSIAN